MVVQISNLLPGLPPMSTLSVVGFSIVAASLLFFLLSRAREFLLIGGISLLYAAVPMLPMLKHF